MDKICGLPVDEFLKKIEVFHGAPAPGVVIGGIIVDLLKDLIGSGVETDAIVESRYCLPDAVQLFTPCTIGNGWMKILDLDKFAITLYDRHLFTGFRAWLDLEKTKAFPNLYNWYMRKASKKDLPLEVLLETLLHAGRDVLTYRPVLVTLFAERYKKGDTGICPRCDEAYALSQGVVCSACQGKAYYEYQDLPSIKAVG